MKGKTERTRRLKERVGERGRDRERGREREREREKLIIFSFILLPQTLIFICL
jgi:hypothetical protein